MAARFGVSAVPQDEPVLDYLPFELLVGHVRVLRFVFSLSVVY